MSATVYVNGGFNNSTLNGASPAHRQRVLDADREWERQVAVEERELAARKAQLQDQAMRASIQMALDRGEMVDMREALRNGGDGRTHRQIVEHMSAMADLEDAGRDARLRKEFAEFQKPVLRRRAVAGQG